MNSCPRCQSPVTTASRCPQCGFDLSLLRQLESLESEVVQTRTLLRESLDRVSRKMTGLRQECVAVLSREVIPATPPPVPEEVAPVYVVAESTAPVTGWTPPPVPTARPEIEAAEPPKENWNDVPLFGQLTEAQFGQKWLLIVGVVIMLFGVAYFLKYSFDRNWISPAVRVLMAYGVGGALLGIGDWFRRRHENFGLCLAGGGIAALYFSTFAAFEIYHLLPSPLAFGLMIVVTALAGTLALTYDTKWLAVLGLVGGFATPFLIDTGSKDHVALFTYISVLNAGLLWIAFHKQWRLLNYLGFLFTWACSVRG